MGEIMSRILIKTTVQKFLREMKESPERSIRNLLDMAVELADGQFQQDIFGTMRKMLEDPGSAYYALIQDATRHIDEKRLLTCGMNMGYNGCTLGAERIRRVEEKEHFNIPWTLVLQLGEEIPEQQYRRLIQEGEDLGVYNWFLFSKGHTAKSMNLAAQFPESAFTVFCDPGEITWPVIDYASERYNLMLAVPLDEDAEMVCSLLREAELLYSVYKLYDAGDLKAIASGDLFCEMEQFHGVFSAFVPKPDCPEEVQAQVYPIIHSARMAQTYATVLWELRADHLVVDKIISDDGCWGSFDSHGRFHTDRGIRGSMETPLRDLLTAAFPKK